MKQPPPKNHAHLPWRKFLGSAIALKYNRRELLHLDSALAFVPGRTAAVQAGGNLGVFPLVLAESFAAVYTFEPDPDNFAKLRANARAKNVHAYCAALGPEAGVCTLSRLRRKEQGSGHQHEGLVHVARVGEGPTPVVTIDSFDLPVLDLIYLDIEGFELFALRGATATLARCRPVVVVEINQNQRFMGLEPGEVAAFLQAQGYAVRATLKNDVVFLPEERTS